MKKLLFCLLGSIVLFYTVQAQPQQVTVTGRIENLANDTLFVYVTPFGEQTPDTPTDTVVTRHGQFDLQTHIPCPSTILFAPAESFEHIPGGIRHIHNKDFSVYATPGASIKLKGHVDVMTYYLASKDDLNARYTQAILRPTASLRKQIITLSSSLSDTPETEIGALVAQMRACADTLYKFYTKYILHHPEDPLSALLLTSCRTLNELDSLYAGLDETVRHSIFQPFVEKHRIKLISNIKRAEAEDIVVPGQPAPDFTLPDTAGRFHSLSALRGKYVVLDFWGTWCYWCIKGIPEMKRYYEKYRDRCEFIGIACNDTPEKWETEVAEQGLPWLNVINESSDIAKDVEILYNIVNFPTKILIDPDGTIVCKITGESPEFYQTLDRILSAQ